MRCGATSRPGPSRRSSAHDLRIRLFFCTGGWSTSLSWRQRRRAKEGTVCAFCSGNERDFLRMRAWKALCGEPPGGGVSGPGVFETVCRCTCACSMGRRLLRGSSLATAAGEGQVQLRPLHQTTQFSVVHLSVSEMLHHPKFWMPTSSVSFFAER